MRRSLTVLAALTLATGLSAQEAPTTPDPLVTRINDLTDTFLAALVSDPPQASHAFFTPWLADGVPLADWQAMRSGHLEQFGALTVLAAHFTGQRDDGDIQVMFNGSFGENPRDLVCGVMVWDEPRTDDIGIRLIYLNFLPEAKMVLIPAEDLKVIARRAGCPDGLLQP